MILRRKKGHHSSLILWLFLLVIFITISIWRSTFYYQRPAINALPSVPSESALKLIAASDQSFSYRLIIFWLQQFDVQAGQYVSFRTLDYEKLTSWLSALSAYEPDSQYPMLLAARIYSRVSDEKRVRQMLAFIYQQYKLNPEKNWRWLSEATITAQHKLKDKKLALKYATALAKEKNDKIPFWAKDMRLLILEQMGETEQVRLLVGGLLANKLITDENEIRFLGRLLQRIEAKSGQNVKKVD